MQQKEVLINPKLHLLFKFRSYWKSKCACNGCKMPTSLNKIMFNLWLTLPQSMPQPLSPPPPSIRCKFRCSDSLTDLSHLLNPEQPQLTPLCISHPLPVPILYQNHNVARASESQGK